MYSILQDEISSRVVSAIAPTLEQAEIERSRRKPTQNLDAYDFYLRGVSFAYEQRKEANQKALDLFHKASALDPEFALAFAHAANCYQRAKSWGWSTNHAQEAIEAERLARRALELDRKDPRVLAIAGWVLAYEVGHVDEGAALLDSAIELDPNLFMGWEFRGWTSLINGEQNAIEYFESALRLSPLDPRLFSAHSGIANAHFIAGRYDEALAWAAKALRQYQHLPALWVLIASYALTGRAAQARAAYEEYKKLHPTARISNMREWARTTDEVYDKYAAGFRLAGMPE